jgi:hypothetical protein
MQGESGRRTIARRVDVAGRVNAHCHDRLCAQQTGATQRMAVKCGAAAASATLSLSATNSSNAGNSGDSGANSLCALSLHTTPRT